MQRTHWIVQAAATCTFAALGIACSPGPGPDDSSRWYGPPGNGAPAASAGEDTDDAGDTDGGKADSGTDGSADEGPGGSSGPSSDDPGDAATSGDATTGVDSSGNEVLDACLEIAADACEMCGCNSCLDTLEACELDAGCVAMRECAQASGCADTVSCYEACQSVIDDNGGALGESAGLAAALSECMDSNCTAVCS